MTCDGQETQVQLLQGPRGLHPAVQRGRENQHHRFGCGDGVLDLSFTTEENSQKYVFYPKGDLFYDLWVYERILPAETESALLDSFALQR